jgi:hypothetical protein
MNSNFYVQTRANESIQYLQYANHSEILQYAQFSRLNET